MLPAYVALFILHYIDVMQALTCQSCYDVITKGGSWVEMDKETVYNIQNYYSKTDYKLAHLGCWNSHGSEIADTMTSLEGTNGTELEGTNETRKDPIDMCKQAANKKGWNYFGIQNGGWCVSGWNARLTYMKYGKAAEDCCVDHKGGDSCIDVYKIRFEKDEDSDDEDAGTLLHVHMGCWISTGTDIVRTMNSLEESDTALDWRNETTEDAVTKCTHVVIEKGWSMLGLYDGGRCVASDEAESYNKYDRAEEGCCVNKTGGDSCNDVYEIIRGPYCTGAPLEVECGAGEVCTTIQLEMKAIYTLHERSSKAYFNINQVVKGCGTATQTVEVCRQYENLTRTYKGDSEIGTNVSLVTSLCSAIECEVDMCNAYSSSMPPNQISFCAVLITFYIIFVNIEN